MIPGDDFELDVHQQRRRVLWQRTYLQALDRLMSPQDFSDGHYKETRGDLECSRRAGELATDAVKRFDDWENSQPAQRGAAPSGGGDPDSEGDDPEGLYLGGGGR